MVCRIAAARTVGDEDVVVRPGLDPGEHGAQRLPSQRHRLATLLVVLHLRRAVGSHVRWRARDSSELQARLAARPARP